MTATTQPMSFSSASFASHTPAQSSTASPVPDRSFFAVLLRCLSAFNA
jgi:hypothetical protein